MTGRWVEPGRPEHAAGFVARMEPGEVEQLRPLGEPAAVLAQIIAASRLCQVRMDDAGPIGLVGAVAQPDESGMVWMLTNPDGLRHLHFIGRETLRFCQAARQVFPALRVRTDIRYPTTIKCFEMIGFAYGPEIEAEGRRYREGILP